MRHEPNLRADSYRARHPRLEDSPRGSNLGYFEVGPLRVISSGACGGENDTGWEHVSVSLPDRCPTWKEMCRVKDLFWRDDEAVVQFHPPRSDYKNLHPFCLHLWRNPANPPVLPPSILVAP